MKKENNQHKEELVLKVEAAYDQAWQTGDVEGIVACLTEDAVLISPRGDVACGQQEIRNLLSEFLDGPARGSTHTGRIIRVNFVTDDVQLSMGKRLLREGNSMVCRQWHIICSPISWSVTEIAG